VKTEADSDGDIIECLYDDKPTTGMTFLSLFSSVTVQWRSQWGAPLKSG